MSKKISPSIIIAGVICLTVIEIFAMLNGFNGTLRMIIIGIICLAIGVNVPRETFIK